MTAPPGQKGLRVTRWTEISGAIILLLDGKGGQLEKFDPRDSEGQFDENQFDPSEPEVHNADFCPPHVTIRSEGAKGAKGMLERGDGIMRTYVDAVEEFRDSATQFMQHLNLLAQARDAYQQAITASAELRTVLDTGDENLRTLMVQMEQALNLHMSKPAIDNKKKPEAVRVEAFKPNGENAGGVRTFP
jgi:hypothetical protein